MEKSISHEDVCLHMEKSNSHEDEKPRQPQNPPPEADESDEIKPAAIISINDFFREFLGESKKLWRLAAPAIFTCLCQYSLAAATQVFAGHLGAMQLAAVSVGNSVVSGLAFGILMGMGSALETLCGQAFGAGQLPMLGIYMQRSWVILISASILMMFLFIFAGPILSFIGQPADISKATGTFSLWMIPQLFAFAMVFPLSKFLQAQRKMKAMAVISAVALVLHVFFSWLVMVKLGWGLGGAAAVLDSSWWIIVVAEVLYIFSGACGETWSGFSWQAFHGLWGFVKLSLASAVMLCLEFWYFMALILFAGYLKNAKVAVDALSICMNILGWAIMVAFGFNVGISVRVSNELGAGRPRTAKFAVVVAAATSLFVGLFMVLVLLIFRKQYLPMFSDNKEVQQLAYKLTPLLGASIVINNIQPTLSGVAIGAGWQAYVAYVNIGCYYLFGIPLGLVSGYRFHLGVKGIWYGMLCGTGLQTCVLLWMIYHTNWNKEASVAGDRVRRWAWRVDRKKNDERSGRGQLSSECEL
ncbi:protein DETOXIFICATION 29-like [Diospyros lotus]|uniref:protein DETOXIFICATION 29-like n=1 Tax=Diospyros lotus TaxID=55363 RepID=UPI00224FB466|nr:protein DETOXIFICATION 29-like [Diospyros lotus]